MDIPVLLTWLEVSGNLNGSSKYIIDLGANDGTGSTQYLFQQQGFSGLLVEGNPDYLPALNAMYPGGRVKKRSSYITPSTALELLADEKVPFDPYFFKIDMDADDCATVTMLLKGGFQPRVIQMEITYDLPWPWSFAVYPLTNYAYTVHYGFQSCSIAFAWAMMKAYGYSLVSAGGTKDLVFVHTTSMKGLVELDPQTSAVDFGKFMVSVYLIHLLFDRLFFVPFS